MAKSHKATIAQRCKKITSDITKINEYIHETGMLIVRHAAPEALNGHHDCETALMLAKAMPKSYRLTMLVEWFRKYTPIVVKLSDKGDAVGFDPKYRKLEPKDKATAKREDGSPWWDIEGAKADPFYSIADRTPEVAPFDFAKALKAMEQTIKRMEKEALSDKNEADADEKKHVLEFAITMGKAVDAYKNAPKPSNEDKPKAKAKAKAA